jgi:hypothetical protein
MIRKTSKTVFVLLCLTNILFGQTQTKVDTITCGPEIKIIIEYPSISRVNNVNYEEGFFKTISCGLDTVSITIHCGSMVNLPLTDLKNKKIYSEFKLGKDIRIIRGYSMVNGRKKYFREDNYNRYGITFVYQNVNENKLMFYELLFNNIKIE